MVTFRLAYCNVLYKNSISEASVGQNVAMETINVFPPRVVLGAIQGSVSHVSGLGYIKGLYLLMVSTDPIRFSRMDIL